MNPEPEPLLSRLPEIVRGPVAEAIRDASWIKVRRALAAFELCAPTEQGPEVSIQILASFELEGRFRAGAVPGTALHSGAGRLADRAAQHDRTGAPGAELPGVCAARVGDGHPLARR